MHRTLFGIALSILSLGAPLPGAPPAPTQTSPAPLTREELQQFLAEPLDFDLGQTSAEIRAALGPPLKSRIAKTPNRHRPSQIDEVLTLVYPGLTLVMYKVNLQDGPAYELPLETVITSSNYRLKHGLAVGAPLERVRSRLGQPAKEDRRTATYEDDEGFVSLVFHHRNGIIRKIEYLRYPD